MLEAVLGTRSAERVLLFLAARETGYASEIARAFETDITPIKNQLERMERESLLISKQIGRTRLYSFNPRYAFKNEVRALMERAIELLPDKIRNDLTMNRRRPRKKNKPL
jgi:predicted transcriptional regulator